MTARRAPAVVLALVLLVAFVLGPPAGAGGPPALVRAVAGVGFTVADLDQAVDFYVRVLFFDKLGETEVAGAAAERLYGVPGLRARVARLRLGQEVIELTEYLAPRGRPVPPDSRSHDRWFQHIAIVVNDMDQAYLWLRRHRVRHVSPAPQTLPAWNPAAGGIRAFYFTDPDGHVLELIQFPPDKGDPRWQAPGDRVFLGIDHTAIVVADTAASLRLYRDALGLRVAGRSENWGPEQERLNNVAGARLRITTLRAGRGPGIELLEYLSPGDGRPYPADARPADLLHWQTMLAVDDLPAAGRALAAGRYPLISPGPVGTAAAGGAGLLARDPDGHALLLRAIPGSPSE